MGIEDDTALAIDAQAEAVEKIQPEQDAAAPLEQAEAPAAPRWKCPAPTITEAESQEINQRQRKLSNAKALPAKTAKVPFWPDALRAAPNIFIRSAIFAALKKGFRQYLNDEELFALGGVFIRCTGEQLDQSNFDVWLNVVHALRGLELGKRHRLTSYQLLKIMGKTDHGQNYLKLEKRLRRLTSTVLTITHNGQTFSGSLLAYAAKDEITGEWVIELGLNLCQFFGKDDYTLIDWNKRHTLKRHQSAQCLHAFYSSHAEPYSLEMETLLKLIGSKDANPSSSTQTLREALDAISEAYTAKGDPFSYKICGKKVEVKKAPSRSQRKHLINKIIKPKK